MAITIRPARPSDGDELREIERLAGEQFRSVGMDEIADDSPPSLDVLAAYAAGGRSWVAVDGSGDSVPVGYAIVDVVETAAIRGAKGVPSRPLVTDGDGRTDVPGVYAAGDVRSGRPAWRSWLGYLMS